jgi:hypothetical protein
MRERLLASDPLRGFIRTVAAAIDLVGKSCDVGEQLLIDNDYRNDREASETFVSDAIPHSAYCLAAMMTRRTDSAAGRRLVVLSVADVLTPGGTLALFACFRQRQMREQTIGRSAVPM